MRLLVVEPDIKLRNAITESLRGHAVDAVADLPDADRPLAENSYDLVILDLVLPSGRALDFLRTRRADGWLTPALVLAESSREGRIAVEHGADDYLVKPFATAELVARIMAVGRRSAPAIDVGRRFRGSDDALLGKRSPDIRAHRRPPPARTGGGDVDATATLPVTIYLGEESGHELVQAAVENLVRLAGGEIVGRDDPVLGSWFRRMRARMRPAASRLGRETALMAAHALDSRLVLAQDATVTATMMQNLGPVLTSLQSTKDAVIRVGALLIVKVEWTVAVHQLTAAQQLVLDHRPQLLTSPQDILAALRTENGHEELPGKARSGAAGVDETPQRAIDAATPFADGAGVVAGDLPDGVDRRE
ncbi:response regulator transcription factor [Amycolatopsis taiwanensis]|uniref:response regulator transcription factor n=1 Tax=Amycolatopsis taiwanensis TaxID=342230 RepID=UPI0012EC7A64|nr:response regulator [Amycolatopsis taiwanensis]